MNKIIFLNDWGDSIETQYNRYTLQTPNGIGEWGNIKATKNINEADYYIIMDGYPDYKSLNPKKKIYFQREPSAIVPNHKFKNDECLYKGSYENHFRLLTWHINLPFQELVDLPLIPKNKKISTITSNKTITSAQNQRIKLVKDVKNQIPSMDFYGNGFRPLKYNSYCKLNGLYPYEYSIACENQSVPNYFTEKLIDCFLSWTKPIYWGCPNIHEYFPPESYAYIDMYDEDAPRKILEEIKKPINYDAIKESRDLVLYKYNLWPAIDALISNF